MNELEHIAMNWRELDMLRCTCQTCEVEEVPEFPHCMKCKSCGGWWSLALGQLSGDVAKLREIFKEHRTDGDVFL